MSNVRVYVTYVGVVQGQSWKVEQQRVELSKGTQSDHMMLAYAYKVRPDSVNKLNCGLGRQS